MDLQTLIGDFLSFLNDSVVPFILAIAFVIFLWNAFRYFIIGGSSTDGQTKAKSLATWSIAAFVIIVSLWGIVNFIARALTIDNTGAVTPDYPGFQNYECEQGNDSTGTCRGQRDSLDNYNNLPPVDTSNFRDPMMPS